MPADEFPEKRLIELAAKPKSAEFRAAVEKHFAPEQLRSGDAWAGYGPEFLWTGEAHRGRTWSKGANSSRRVRRAHRFRRVDDVLFIHLATAAVDG
jgi:hypothetical protein